MIKSIKILGLFLLALSLSAQAEKIGSVDTDFKLIGPDNKIEIEAFDDEGVPGVTCYISRAKTGGLSGAVGIAEDKADASLSCHQTGPITLNDKIKAGKEDGDDVFKKRTSLVFKSMQVVRFYDKKHNALVYMVYSDRILKGSPNNSITAVPILPWPGQSSANTVPAGK
ncbi:MAG: CreA family protein [Methylococcaceae bacterium]|nr:CreA family protein [Methylococcaceae bacterium]